ncbi:uncharacterized protein LOC118201468 [Stegodyphus dumicola]|uniref:uncharacterized protein LOC118201468 n=1 Tax=Stegodyphus dumicola TaxID=202533 RepID=UPI0015B1DD23|nr:uncharacterized protein LOC118201468 [Stegodyphus dumicola]
MVLEYAMTNRLSIINTSDSPPTFRTIRAEGWPDLTMVSSQLANQMSEWHVMDILSLSDHRIISYLMGAQLTYTLKQRFKTAYGGHQKFLNLLRPYVGQLIFNFQASNTIDGLDDAYRHLIGTLTSAAKQTYKKKTPSQKKELSWWNDKLTANRSRVRALRRLAQSETDSIQRDQKMQTYKKALAQYKLQIIKAKSDSWQEHCSRIPEIFGKIQKIAAGKVFRPTQLTANVAPDAPNTRNILSVILKTVFPSDDPANDSETHTLIRTQFQEKFWSSKNGDYLPPTIEEVDLNHKWFGKEKGTGAGWPRQYNTQGIA